MKISFQLPICVGLLACSWSMFAGEPAPEITFNGVTTIFGDARALFKVREANGAEKFYFLSAGQRDGEVELIAFDVEAKKITVRDGNAIQTLRLYDAPEVSASAVSNGNGSKKKSPAKHFTRSDSSNGISPDVATSGSDQENSSGESTSNHPEAGEAATDSSDPKNSASPDEVNHSDADNQTSLSDADENTSAAQNDDSPVDARTGKIDPLWVSRQVEAARIRMADAVRSGQLQPFPSTPLTPAGTPADLISTNSIQAIPVMQ